MEDKEKINLIEKLRRIEDKIESSITENQVLVRQTKIFGIPVKTSLTFLDRREKWITKP